MKISFHGAARTVTGSKHLLQLESGKKILLDCGLFQGMGPETINLNANFGFDAREVSYVILSHAHIDHTGLLPKLVKEGFKGKIYCTPATAELTAILMADSAHIQESDAAHINKIRERQGKHPIQPLYSQADAQDVEQYFVTIDYATSYKIDDEVTLYYTDCGHISGSAAVNLAINEDGKTTRITFSGDVGRYGDAILKSPEPFPQADYVIMESTYGDKLHDLVAAPADKLLGYIEETCVKKGGKLIIPAFSLGRTQEVLYLLNRLELERRLPAISYYVDSPLSIQATEIIKSHPEDFNDTVARLLSIDDDVFAFPGLQYITEVSDSIALNNTKEPSVIIAASGMAEAGRVKHHIANNISDAANTVLIVGYCEPHSLGGKLASGVKEVKIFGEEYQVAAGIEQIDSMSAHGDYGDLLKWLSCQDAHTVRQLFLVHGEYETQVAFRTRILNKGFKNVTIPVLHQEVVLW
ncbi:MAG: MBL fold metallo-hydrolase [Taibaiella sp.]|nr:MBL fold metallo-hydrolase [Taibaiella sp.]